MYLACWIGSVILDFDQRVARPFAALARIVSLDDVPFCHGFMMFGK